MVRSLTLALMLFSNAAYAAGYTKPAGVPEAFVPAYGVTVGVWAAQTAVGHGIGVFENNGSGWTLCGMCMVDAQTPNLDGAVAYAGGVGPFVAGKIADVNAVLALRYPAVGNEPTGTTLDRVNGSLSGYGLRMVNGSPQLGSR